MQADILTTITLPASLFIIMFSMGLTLQTTDFTRILMQPTVTFIGLSGKTFTSVIGIISIGTVALLAGLLVSGFSKALRQ